MRWKLILITSFFGAFVAGGAWCLLTIVGFSQFPVLANYPWLAAVGVIIPVLLSTLSAIFVYRRTAQRRKTQAFMTMLLTLLLTVGVYVFAMRFFQMRVSVVTLPTRSISG
jgi:hypothetical protein